ncbi:MAG TPA: trypsin-like peptidase domain-containing protein [Spirochaetia bacterium]|nr:trypsin-like peptidase domain-containing protein [Spirochaetia bacterium]
MKQKPENTVTLRRFVMLSVALFVFAPALFAQSSTDVAPYPAANTLEAQIEAVGRNAGPSVVNITSTVVTQNFFSQPVPQQAVGSGFIYDNQGHIVTNFHVIENASTVVVTLRSGKSYQARVIGSDPSTDLAVLKIDAPELPTPLQIGNSARVQVGQFVVALGNPFGLSHTLTFGVISAKGRIIKSPNGRFIGEALQTDTPINPGNSGGPLLTLGGEVIGVNSQIISPSGSSAGIGFAIPANLVEKIVPQLISTGHAEHPYLGIQGVDLSPALAQILKQVGVAVPVDRGVMIASVAPGSPAGKAGLVGANQVATIMNSEIPVGGDVIVAVDGQPITSFQDLSAYLESESQVGQRVMLTIYRGSNRSDVSVTLGSRPAGQ